MININTSYTAGAVIEHRVNLEKKLKFFLNNKSKLPKYVKKYIDKNLSELLIGKPQELLRINDVFYTKELEGNTKKIKRINRNIKKMFRYDLFSSKKKEYNAYSLADNLKIDCCPNCNRQYIITVIDKGTNKGDTRPDFDHYFPQSKYPLLALSFYNLIPSCKICNSTFKGDEEMNLKIHLHPYIDNVLDDFSFDFELSTLDSTLCDKIKIEVNPFSENKDRIESTFELFRLEKVYNAHKSIVNQMIRLKEELSEDYLKVLQNTYKGGFLTIDDAYELGFGVPSNKEDFYTEPFSKLKRDITERLDMIPPL